MSFIKVWCDGACFPNPGMGGWGWTTLQGQENSGGLVKTTNQVMELTAAVDAVRTLKGKYEKILVVTDSMYVISCATKWWPKWESNGWLSSEGNPVKNRELIEELISITWAKGVSFEWVKGHSGDPGNERADDLATSASKADAKLIAKCKGVWH